MSDGTRPTNGNGAKKLAQYIGSFWYLIAIGGVVVTLITWGVSLRQTVERNHGTVLKQEREIDALQARVSNLEKMLIGSPAPRELYEAMRTGAERNHAQDERISDLVKRIERMEQKHP